MQTACKTCRARKLACDKTRPHCLQCCSAGRNCGGYPDKQSYLYVNFDSENITRKRRKRVLCEAIADRNRRDQLPTGPSPTQAAEHRPCPSSSSPILASIGLRARSIDTLELSHEAWLENLSGLWNDFTSNFAISPYAWAYAFNDSINQSTVLDFALLALSTSRLAQTHPNDPHVRSISLSAYGSSLCQFSHLLGQTRGHIAELDRLPDLSVIALVYTLIEGTLQSPSTIFSSGWATSSPHCRAAKSFALRAGPKAFAIESSQSSIAASSCHRAFLKLREMDVLNCLANSEASPFGSPDWLDIPFTGSQKTWRDQLFDIALLTTVLTYDLQVKIWGESTAASILQLTIDVGALHAKLAAWNAAWQVTEASSNLADPEDAHTLLHTEYLTIRLILTLADLGLLSARLSTASNSTDALSPRQTTDTDSTVETHAAILASARSLTTQIKSALDLPVFNIADENVRQRPGIVEGQCRSLLSVWVVRWAEAELKSPSSNRRDVVQ